MARIDIARWHALLETTEEQRGVRHALMGELTELRDREGRSRGALMRAEDKDRSRYGELDEAARLEDHPGYETRPDRRRQMHADDFAKPIILQRSKLAELMAQISRYEARVTPVRARLAELHLLQDKCQKWAAANGIALPTKPGEHVEATLPDAGRGRALDLPSQPGFGMNAAPAAPATAAVPALTVDALRRHRLMQAERLLALGIRQDEDTLVCCDYAGQPLSPRSITKRFSDLSRKLGLGVRFYDLRHSHISHLLAAGVHPKVASERAGHASVAITLDVYSHLIAGMQEDAAARIDAALRIHLDQGQE